MPIYEFSCGNCKKDFELLLSIRTDLSTVVCPTCNGGKVNKKVSNFARGGGSSNDSTDFSDHSSSHSGCGSCATHSCGSCGHH
ncbi:MAG: zinc ribbon domain-containing protein [Candidatus Riflebacteria bacterium]|nr:zinc ribbon domain-containing protein [Candidatus Riflebacteria bacterium]